MKTKSPLDQQKKPTRQERFVDVSIKGTGNKLYNPHTLIEKLPNSNNGTNFSWCRNMEIMVDKINELIDAVNKLNRP